MTLRQVHLHPESMPLVTRILFILPVNGNDEEYMAIEAKDAGFVSLLAQARDTARRVIEDEANQKAKAKREEDYKLYLKLKAEFEPA